MPKGHIFASCEMLGAVLVFIVICFMGTNFRIIGWSFMVRSRALLLCPTCSMRVTLALSCIHIACQLTRLTDWAWLLLCGLLYCVCAVAMAVCCLCPV